MIGEAPAPETTAVPDAPRYARILLGTDGSACSQQAARHAVYLAGSLGAELFVLNAVDVADAFHVGIHFGEAVKELESSGRKALQAVREIADECGVTCKELLVQGRPHAAIIRAAQEVGADLVVVGSKGVSSVERALMGSEAAKVLHYAKPPVLVVRHA